MRILNVFAAFSLFAVSNAQAALLVIRMPEPTVVAELSAGAAVVGYLIWRFSKKR